MFAHIDRSGIWTVLLTGDCRRHCHTTVRCCRSDINSNTTTFHSVSKAHSLPILLLINAFAGRLDFLYLRGV